MKGVMVASLLFLLVACAGGPKWQAQQYSQALAKKDANAAQEMMATSAGAISPQVIEEAIMSGNVGEMPMQADWDRSEATATVLSGGDIFVLAKTGDDWKIRCATIGPYHNRTPEMTLLFAIHLIRNMRFDNLLQLVPDTAGDVSGAFKDAFKQELAQWAETVSPMACQPFSIDGNEAHLNYGEQSGKQIRMVLENAEWKIADLW